MTARWYVAYTQPRMERWARTNLWERGVEVYLPMHQKRRRHARRTEWVSAPLFPRYVFVNADLAVVGARAIASARGVVNMVSYGSEPAVVRPSIIDGIREREDTDGVIRLEYERVYKPGEAVQICGGPFLDHRALFEADGDSDRVVVLLNLLGRQTRAQISRENLSPARWRRGRRWLGGLSVGGNVNFILRSDAARDAGCRQEERLSGRIR